MSTLISYNGVSYTIPATGDTNWGDQVSTFLIAVAGASAVLTSQIQSSRTVTSATNNALTTDYAIHVNFAGAALVVLPASTIGQVYVIEDASNAALTNNVTVSVPGGQTIDGASTYIIRDNSAGVAVQFIGTNSWRILAIKPQDLRSSATPKFTGLNISGLTTSSVVLTDGSNNLGSIGYASANLATRLVSRDVSGNFAATTITAALVGNATTATTAAAVSGIVPIANGGTNSATVVAGLLRSDGTTVTGGATVQNADVGASAAIAVSKLGAMAVSRAVVTDGSGLLATSTVTSTTLAFLDVSSSVQTQINSKQATITTGSTAQYFKGDLSLGTLNQAAVAGLTTGDSPTFTSAFISGVAGIKLQTTGGSQSSLNYYEENVAITSGASLLNSTYTSYSLRLTRIGRLVTMTVNLVGGAYAGGGSNPMGFSAVIPARFRPLAETWGFPVLQANGSYQICPTRLLADGSIYFYLGIAAGAFTTGGTLATYGPNSNVVISWDIS